MQPKTSINCCFVLSCLVFCSAVFYHAKVAFAIQQYLLLLFTGITLQQQVKVTACENLNNSYIHTCNVSRFAASFPATPRIPLALPSRSTSQNLTLHPLRLTTTTTPQPADTLRQRRPTMIVQASLRRAPVIY